MSQFSYDGFRLGYSLMRRKYIVRPVWRKRTAGPVFSVAGSGGRRGAGMVGRLKGGCGCGIMWKCEFLF